MPRSASGTTSGSEADLLVVAAAATCARVPVAGERPVVGVATKLAPQCQVTQGTTTSVYALGQIDGRTRARPAAVQAVQPMRRAILYALSTRRGKPATAEDGVRGAPIAVSMASKVVIAQNLFPLLESITQRAAFESSK